MPNTNAGLDQARENCGRSNRAEDTAVPACPCKAAGTDLARGSLSPRTLFRLLGGHGGEHFVNQSQGEVGVDATVADVLHVGAAVRREGGWLEVLWPRRLVSLFWLSHNRKLRARFGGSSIVRCVKPLDVEELAAIDRAGRRCAVCRTGRRWREFTVLRPHGGEPIVMCAACRARYGDAPPAPTARERADAPAAHAEEPTSTTPERRAPEREDRVRRALHELPKGEHTTGRIAKAAGLNHPKTLRRLRQLAESGEIREVGKRWSTEPPPTDIDEALDRLQARTSNIRIVRERSLVD
jgi:hypothetical protein